MRHRSILSLSAGLAALALSACATGGYHHGRHAYSGGEWSGPRQAFAGELHGPGVDLLDPWLKETREGRAVVTLGFRDAARGFVSEAVARRANSWFRRYADQDCDMRITDPEIRVALATAAGRYLR